jgi:hypothetical protein
LAASARDALRAGYAQTPAEGVLCVTGSLYLIGEIQAAMTQSARTEVAKRP